MKRFWLAAWILTICIMASACRTAPESTPAGTTSAPPPATTTVAPMPTTVPVPPTTVPPEPTRPPIFTGWQQVDGKRYFFLTDGTKATGWVEIKGLRYYFGNDGAMRIGWLKLTEGLYYLGKDGVMVTGWQELEGKRYCFATSGRAFIGWLEQEEGRYYLDEDGVMVTGWQELDGKYYCFDDSGRVLTGWHTGEDGAPRYLLDDGTMAIGWTQIGSDRYYFADDGIARTGWLELEGKRYLLGADGAVVTGWFVEGDREYYLRQDGSMARGHVRIDGKDYYFTSSGQQVLLVNPWNYVPEGYDPELVKIQRFGAYNNMLISAECYDALMQMLSDCKAAGFKTYIVSAYRTQEFQEKNYQRKVNDFLDKGYSEEEARVLAAQVVAIPGTSEHQLGLALDIVDASWPYLENAQANKPAQKWLMEHSWEYGFILRYPADKTDVTGIIYEPWHYRYVGQELAKELHECGLTLEEYLAALTET